MNSFPLLLRRLLCCSVTYHNTENAAGLPHCNITYVLLFDNGTAVGTISLSMARYDSGLVLMLPVFSLPPGSYISWQNIFIFLSDLFHILTADVHLSC
jgi:hypothetical protein